MELNQIYTKRSMLKQNYAQPIIFEWEDVIASEMNIRITHYQKFYKLINKMGIHASFIAPSSNTFRFVTNGKDYDEPMNNDHIIPCIIDFFETKDQLKNFYRKHSRNKLVLLSSPFDYEFLIENNCPLNIGLFAYSLSDIYTVPGITQKKYDIVLTGRQDPLLYSFFVKYVKDHPEVTYVKRGRDLENDIAKTKEYYLNCRECLGNIESREEFMKLQTQGRVTLYGLQGYLDGYGKGYYHMTPHFLEIIACGCHVLARYPLGKEGIDAQYYEFDKFSPSINTYEEFEATMEKALNTNVDIDMYSSYLSKHYTSNRVVKLKELLAKL